MISPKPLIQLTEPCSSSSSQKLELLETCTLSSQPSTETPNQEYTQWQSNRLVQLPYRCETGGYPKSTYFIDDLAKELKETWVGKNIEDLKTDENEKDNPNSDIVINTLFYVDDIVCLTESEEDLQKLLNVIYSWCFKWRFEVNVLKIIFYMWGKIGRKK